MFSHQNIAALSKGPICHCLSNQLPVAKNSWFGCDNHRYSKSERKEDFRKTIEATAGSFRDLPLPENPKNQNEDGVSPQMHQALAHLKYTLLRTNLAELPSKVRFFHIGIDRKIALLPPLEFLQEVDSAYLLRHHNLQKNEEDVYNTDNFAEESIKIMFKHKVATA